MKDSQYFPGQPNSWNGGVMSTSGGGGRREEGGRAGGSYPPWPPAHHPMHRHHLPSPASHSPLPRMVGGYFAGRVAPPAASYSGGGWTRPTGLKPPDRWTPAIEPNMGGQVEGGMDLSQSRPNGSQPNGVSKEPVSVIATNPHRSSDKPLEPSDRSEDEDEDCMVIEEGEEAPRTGELPPHRVLPRHLPEPTRQQAPSIGLEAPTIEAPPAHQNPLAPALRLDPTRPESSQHLPPRQELGRPESSHLPLQRVESGRSEAIGQHSRPEPAAAEASHNLSQRMEPISRPESSHHLTQRLETTYHVPRPESSHHLPPSVSQPLRSDASSPLHKLSLKESSLQVQQAFHQLNQQQLLIQKQVPNSSLHKLSESVSMLQQPFQPRQDPVPMVASRPLSEKRKEELAAAHHQIPESFTAQIQHAVRPPVEAMSATPLYRESVSPASRPQLDSPHQIPFQQRPEAASFPQPSSHPEQTHQNNRQIGLELRPDIASLPPQVQPRPAESAASIPLLIPPVPTSQPNLPAPAAAAAAAKETVPSRPDFPHKVESPKPGSSTETKIKEEEPPQTVDHVESMLENMFQQDNTSTPVVRVSEQLSPALTDDKVVEILQDKDSPVKDEPKPEVKLEVKTEPATPQKSAFMQVESELEKMFAGIVEAPGDSDKPETPESSKSSSKKSSTKRKIRRPKTKKWDLDISKKQASKSLDSVKLKRRFGPKVVKEGSNDSSIVSVYKSRGPLIRVARDKDGRPATITIVNSNSADEERDRSLDIKIKRKAPRIVEGRTKGPGLFSSTLSSKYNSNTIDVTWTCIFCNRRSHCENGLGGEPAGDLFGPYLVHVKLEPCSGGLTDADVASEQRKRGGGKQLSLRAGGQANHSFTPPSKKSRKSSFSEKEGPSESGAGVSREVWVHEACAVWSPGVILVGPHLIGLDDAVSTSLHVICSVCGESGACISCLQHGCHRVCHYGCAKATQWSLDEETFHARCANHKKPVTLSLALHQNSA